MHTQLRTARTALGGLCAAFALALVSASSASAGVAGYVYTSTNATANSIAVYPYLGDGTLETPSYVSTAGTGTVAGLGNEGAIALSGNRRLLFVTNAGSNDISVFRINHGIPTLAGRYASGGTTPTSVTVFGPWLYVLNSGGPGNITGFWIGADGALAPIANSTQPLSGTATGPAEVRFSPWGDALVVTEKATNNIDTYPVYWNGTAGAPVTSPSNGATPYGFAFTWFGKLIVAEAVGGAAGASTVSSYEIGENGALETESASVPDFQSAVCWIAVSPLGDYAYAADTGSGALSVYHVNFDGKLTLATPSGFSVSTGAGSAPSDLALTLTGRLLYALEPGTGSVGAFKVTPGGGLTALGNVGGLAGAHPTGLAVY